MNIKKTILTTATALTLLLGAPAAIAAEYSASGSSGDGPGGAADLTDAQTAWVSNIKSCLLAEKVDLSGDRPGCYLTEDLRLRCLPQYDAAAKKCFAANQSAPPKTAIKW